MGNQCCRVPEWTWGAFEPYSQNVPLGAGLSMSALAHMWLKVKLHRGDYLESLQLPAGRGALRYIGNLCWRVPEWTWGEFQPYAQNGPLGSSLHALLPAHMRLKVKLHRGEVPGIPPTPRSTQWAKLTMLTRPWMDLAGGLSLMVKTGCWMHVCVRQLPPTCDLRSNCIAGNFLASPRLLAGRSAQSYIGNQCWRVPERT